MFCRNCGSTLESRANFCTNCGAQTQPVATVFAPTPSPPLPVPQRRSRVWLYAAGAFGLLLLMGTCTAILSDHTTTSATNSGSSSNVSDASLNLTSRHKIGDDVFVGYWAYKCLGAQWQRSIGSEYSRQYPDAAFLVVDLAIRNNDRTASVLAPLKLVDSEGREYDESSKGVFLDNSFGILKNVNPGVSSRGYVVFDVPRGRYALKVSGGFTSGKSELIDLQ